ncbi:MAG TPA: efflux RND transporter periplasmic adaptor subunit [Woeseiaceae bacterium]|jgi:membrane fusion protein (multidrug efflux system)|nr:efflux RND transporter periplasmic adaptor subunit [Woeseiaceae bacterium]
MHLPRPPLSALLLAIVVLAACGEKTLPSETRTPEVTVVTLTAQPVKLTRELPGRTRAYLIAEVRPRVDGIVEEQLFDEGGMVEAGQPLYQLDDAMYRADHESAEAALTRAEAALEVARLNADRTSELIRTNAISEQERENAVAALHQGEADVGVARAAVASSAVRLGYARITSPITGRVGKSSVTPGALVTANQEEPLATVQQLDPMYVDLSQSASELLALRDDLSAGRLTSTRDLPVTLLLENGRAYEHAGTLKFADLTVEPSTGSVSLRVLVPNPDHLLLPGMYVRAVVSAGVIQEGVLVPQRGITRDPRGNATAMIVGADGKVERRTVEVSRTIGDQWLVDAGLTAGDRVVVAGLQRIRPGMAVKVTPAGAAGPVAASPPAAGDDESTR